MASSTDGSSTMTGWKRRSRAASFSMCLRYSSSVVAPIMCSSPRASIGLSMLPASMAPSAAPAPTTVCSSSTNSRMRPSAALTSLSTALQPLLELAAVLGAGHQGAHVQGEDGPVPQALGHVAAGDALGQALDDGGLADAGIADQHRVVLGLAGQDLDHPPDLGVPADDRVEPAAGRVGDQVAAVLRQRFVGDLGHGRGDPLVAADPGERRRNRSLVTPSCWQQAAGCGGRALRQQGQQQVLDRDVLVLEPVRLLLGRIEQPGQPLGDHDLPGLAPGPLTRGRRASSASSAWRSRSGSAPAWLSSRGTMPSGWSSSASSRCSPSTSVWPKRSALVCASCSASCDFWVRRFGSIGHRPGHREPRRAASSTAIRSSRSVTRPTAA